MIQGFTYWFYKNEKISIFLLLLFFVLIRFLGVHLPLHQDEYKWPRYANPSITSSGVIPHPPLTEIIYRDVGSRIGYDNFRFIPLTFSVLNIILLFCLAKILFNDKKTPLIIVSLFTISFYSVLASLMVDVDGAIMVFFALLLFIGYFKNKQTNWKDWKWIVLLLIGAIGGFLVKLSGALPIAAIALDFAFERKIFSDKKRILKYLFGFLLLAVSLVLVLLLSKVIFPFFDIKTDLVYWMHFWNSSGFLDRGWFQTFIQFIKAILYLSPLLIIPILFVNSEIYKKTRAFFMFIFVGLVFYLFLFDFSIGALDRYFQFLIIPLVIISGAIFSHYIKFTDRRAKEFLFLGLIMGLVLVLLQSLPHYVPALHPKSEWINRVLSLKWNFLYPFSGGSGPLGFYVSFMLIALSWIIFLFTLVFAWIKPRFRNLALILILPIGIFYNVAFTEEYLVGHWNGHAPLLLYHAVDFIKNNNEIGAETVTPYNDNGANELIATGKYKRRLYVDPKFTGQLEYLNMNKQFYFVLDVPRLDPTSFYINYFASCKSIFHEVDKKISATVYDCRNAPDVKK